MSRRSAPASDRASDDGLIDGARRDPRRSGARAGLRRAGAHAAERSRHRARDRPRRRSRRDLRGARAPARRDRHAARRGAARDLPAHAGRRALQPGRRERRTPRAEERLPRPARGGRRAAAIALAARQYHSADNMTDRMAALATLALHAVPERQAALDDFYQRYRDRPADHRQMARPAGGDPRGRDARPRARADAAPGVLVRQPEPRARADRRVRAGNQTQFNRADGAGYDFVADTVLALDAEEPAGRRRACRPRSAPGARSSRRGARTPRPRCGASRPRRTSRAT